MRRTGSMLLLALASCSSGGADTTTPVAAKPVIETKATPAQAAEDEGDCGTGWDEARNAASATAPFDQIDVQLDMQPTYGITYDVAGMLVFSRLPRFTLYRDGTVFYPDPSNAKTKKVLLTAKLDRAAADEIRARVLALGADQLESHVDSCSCPKDAPGGKMLVCLEDGEYHILRYRDSKGELRHVVVYGSYWNRRAIATRIMDYLSSYRAAGAAPYMPTTATFAVLRSDPGDCPNPLDAASAKLLTPPHGYLHVKAVEGSELRTLQTKLPAEGGRAEWCTQDASLRGNLYPTLPGMDHRASIADYVKAMNP